MKQAIIKILTTWIILLNVHFAIGQNTPWPSTSSTDPVGIGTTTPVANMEVKTASGNNNSNIITTTGFDLAYDINRYYSTAIKSQIGLSQPGTDVGGITYWNDGNYIGSGLTSFDKLICNYGHAGDQENFLRLQNPSTNFGNYSLEFKNVLYPASNPSNMWHANWGSTMIAWNMPLNIGSLSDYPVRIYSDPGNSNKIADIFIQGSKVGIGTETPNTNAKLDVHGTILGQRVAIGNIDFTTINGNTDYLLAVNGTAIFNKARVKPAGNWPDYVFKKDYKLPSLDEIEKYINVNQHLPGVPSASEVKKNGIDLGDNQALLLKKIEELTLFLIDLNKKVEQLSAENKILKEKK